MTDPHRHPLSVLRRRTGLSAVRYLRALNQRHHDLGHGWMRENREKVSRWESGRVEPQRTAQLAMADLHGVNAAAVDAYGWPDWLLLAFPDDRVTLDASWDRAGTVEATRSVTQGGGMDRRGFLIATGATLSSVAGQWATAFGQDPATAVGGRRALTGEVVERLTGRLDDLRHLDDELGGADLISSAEAELQLLSRLADTAVYDTQVGRRLFAALAESARLCGWLHFDAGHQAAAQKFYLTALRASATGDVVDVGANTLAFMAIQTYSVGDPRDAVHLARTAQSRAAGHSTPLVAAMLAARTGRALSKTGDADACMRHLDTARALLSQGRCDDDPPWAYWFTPSEIDMLAGSSALDLNRPGEALDHFAAARHGAYTAEGYLRDGALFAARIAEAHLAAGDIDQACATATDAWTQSLRVDSTRPAATLDGFRSKVAAHAAIPAVRDYLDLTRPPSDRPPTRRAV